MNPFPLAPHGSDSRQSMGPHGIRAENAGLFLSWIKTRGGLAVWHTTNQNHPGLSWTCPLNDEYGHRKPKPYAEAENEPRRIITNPDDVLVHTDEEVHRFTVDFLDGKRGSLLSLTDASRARINEEVDRAGRYAYHLFDQATHEAVILAPDGNSMTLTEWGLQHEAK